MYVLWWVIHDELFFSIFTCYVDSIFVVVFFFTWTLECDFKYLQRGHLIERKVDVNVRYFNSIVAIM